MQPCPVSCVRILAAPGNFNLAFNMRYLRHSNPYKRTAALTFRSTVACFALLAFASTSVVAQSTLGLSVNGQTVVPRGQLKSFVYDLGGSRIQARSFFGDVRCTPDDQGTAAPSSLAFELDMFSSKEPEALYEIFEDGEVRYDIAAGMIDVITSSAPGSTSCTHFIEAVGTIATIDGEADIGTFWAGGFESPFRLEAETRPVVNGDTLTVRFTVSNVSEVLVATDILAQFAIGASGLPTGITGPEYSPSSAVVGDVWEVPILWPGESASLDVSYTLDGQIPVGTEIETTIDAVTAFDRTGSEPLATGNAQISIVSATP